MDATSIGFVSILFLAQLIRPKGTQWHIRRGIALLAFDAYAVFLCVRFFQTVPMAQMHWTFFTLARSICAGGFVVSTLLCGIVGFISMALTPSKVLLPLHVFLGCCATACFFSFWGILLVNRVIY